MIKITENASLLSLNTFRMDVRAKVLATYSSEEDLQEILRHYRGERFLSVGEGSNLLFTKDFDGVVLHSQMCRARAKGETDTEVWIEAESGLLLDDLIAQLVDVNLVGLENLSHIPGTVGASAVQNVGAYGVEAKDLIEEVSVVEIKTLRTCVFANQDCRFAYRDSRFKQDWKDQYVITRVTYRLQKNGALRLDYGGLSKAFAGRDIAGLTAADVREAVIGIRGEKLPEVSAFGSAGSFFKNPVIPVAQYQALLAQYPDLPHYEAPDGVKVPAAWLIEQCGWKGRTMGDARVWDKQPLVIINQGKATPEDIQQLAAAICRSVETKFGVKIFPEVNYIW